MSQPCLPISGRRKRQKGAPNATFQESDIQSMSAADYLAAVVDEAKTLPEFLQAPIIESKPPVNKKRSRTVPIDGSAASINYLISSRASITPPPSKEYLPTNEGWIKLTLDNFQNLRNYLKDSKKQGVGGKGARRWALPSMKDRSGWHTFCVGEDEARGNTGAYFGDDDDDDDTKSSKEQAVKPQWMVDLPTNGFFPAVALLLQIDSVLNRRALSHISYYVGDGWSACNPQRSLWLYALLARLEKPMHRDDAATLYGLLKSLALERSKIDPVSRRSDLSSINTLIVIVGLYFGQSDKATIMGTDAT